MHQRREVAEHRDLEELQDGHLGLVGLAVSDPADHVQHRLDARGRQDAGGQVAQGLGRDVN